MIRAAIILFGVSFNERHCRAHFFLNQSAILVYLEKDVQSGVAYIVLAVTTLATM